MLNYNINFILNKKININYEIIFLEKKINIYL